MVDRLLGNMTRRKSIWLAFRTAPVPSTLLTLLTVVGAMIPVAEVYAVAWLVDGALDVVNHRLPMVRVVPAALCVVILVAYRWLSGSVCDLLWSKLALILRERVRPVLVERCAMLDYALFENKDVRECMTRVLAGLTEQLVGTFRTLCDAFVLGIGTFGVLGIVMTKSLWIGLLILGVSIPLMVLARKSGEATWRVSQENTKYERRAAYLGEVLRGREAVLERTLFGYTDRLNKQWNRSYQTSAGYIQRAYRNWYAKIELGSVLAALVSISGVAFLLAPVIRGEMSLGIFVSLANACFTLIDTMSWQMRGIVENLARHKGFMADLNRLLSFRVQAGAVAKRGEHQAFGCIRFVNVSFSYPNSTEPVLKNLSFEICAGKHYALVGANGAGKSTIIKLLLGLYDRYDGEILVDGVELRHLDPSRTKSLFSVVFQDFTPYQLTLRENLALGKANALPDSVVEAVLGELDDSLSPDRPLGRIREGGRDLSGGQWQKIAIARCGTDPAPIRLLDEPTAAVDPVAESHIYENFAAISQDKTTLIISHRLGSTKLADEILVLERGHVVEKGNHQSLMVGNGLYKKMFERQRSWYL